MKSEKSVYYLNSEKDSGKLSDLLTEDVIPDEVILALEKLEDNFTGENLLAYFEELDRWQEMVQDDYIGSIYEVIEENDDHIAVQFRDIDDIKNDDICIYFLA